MKTKATIAQMIQALRAQGVYVSHLTDEAIIREYEGRGTQFPKA